jgi:hypothetical protein
MTTDIQFPLFQKALGRHLSGVRGLKSVNAFLREGGMWREAARLGQFAPERVDAALAAFEPNGGGSIEAIPGKDQGWSATYMLGGPGLDMVLLLRLDGLNPAELQTQLTVIEAKVGWLMLAALSDRTKEIDGVALSAEIGSQVLLDAARARTRRQLADQWIARLERALKPDLIAVTWIKNGKPRLEALSGGGIVDRNSEARSQLEALADQAVRARGPQIIAPLPDLDPNMPDPDDQDLLDPTEQSKHEDALAQVEFLGGTRGLSMPIYNGDEAEAAVIAVWSAGSTAGPLHLEAADLVAQVLGQSLTIQARAFPSVLRRLGNWLFAGFRAVFGKSALKLKVFVLASAAIVLVLTLVSTRHQPTFTARIEAQERRVVSAPFDGFLAQAPFQLGDVITPGELVVAMEDSDLVLQTAQTQSELAEILAEIQTARAQRDTSRVQSLEAQRRQVDVQLELLQSQLDLARFFASGTAAVVGGDAWRRVGGRVRLGEALLELASPETFRVLAFIDEDWVADLKPGGRATLLLTAFPNVTVDVTLANITADPQMRDGINTFSAWMDFAQMPDVLLLDGMRGIVRIDGGPTTMLASYTRGVMRWASRTVWRWT